MPVATAPQAPGEPHDIKDARKLVGDLFAPSSAIYWGDLALSSAVGWGCLIAAACWRPLGWTNAALFFIASLALYRTMFFIHEIVHIKDAQLRRFPAAWNLLCGFPFLLPYFIYDPHLEHHRTGSFATHHDPRYVPLAHGSRFGLILPLLANVLLPLVIAFRFWILSPISWMIGGRFREAILHRASTLVMNPAYVRDAMTPAQRRTAMRQEFGCVLVWSVVFILLAMRVIPWMVLPAWYLAAVAMVQYNYVRALVAHRYINDGEHSVSFREQLLDSITIANPWSLALLIGPVGLRYHSLHHLFPSMPYHHLGAAHRRLVAALPAGHPYLQTLRRGVTPALRDLWRQCAINRHAPIAAPDKAHV